VTYVVWRVRLWWAGVLLRHASRMLDLVERQRYTPRQVWEDDRDHLEWRLRAAYMLHRSLELNPP
jgi:hypothetical protein